MAVFLWDAFCRKRERKMLPELIFATETFNLPFASYNLTEIRSTFKWKKAKFKYLKCVEDRIYLRMGWFLSTSNWLAEVASLWIRELGSILGRRVILNLIWKFCSSSSISSFSSSQSGGISAAAAVPSLLESKIEASSLIFERFSNGGSE